MSAFRLSTPMMDADSVEVGWQPRRVKISFAKSIDALHTVRICICISISVYIYI